MSRWLQDATEAERRAQRLERIRWQREALLAAAADLAQFAQTLTQTEEQSPTQMGEQAGEEP